MRWNAGLAALAAAWGLVAVLAGAVAVLTRRVGALAPRPHLRAPVALGGEDGHGFGWLALACGLGSALTFAVLVILSKRLLHADVPPLTVAFWDCLVGMAAISPVLFFAGTALPPTRATGRCSCSASG
jgi:drug/metabolite transporter (DMT)-like permease